MSDIAASADLNRAATSSSIDTPQDAARETATDARWPATVAERARAIPAQMFQQARYSIDMIRDLPALAVSDATVSGTVRAASLEAFFIHVRAITDFFCCRPVEPHKDDFTARDLLPGWKPAPADAVERLRRHWITASKHVAHFTRERLQTETGDLEYVDVGRAALDAMAADVFAVWEIFIAAT